MDTERAILGLFGLVCVLEFCMVGQAVGTMIRWACLCRRIYVVALILGNLKLGYRFGGVAIAISLTCLHTWRHRCAADCAGIHISGSFGDGGDRQSGRSTWRLC